jgi:hypothetical protein
MADLAETDRVRRAVSATTIFTVGYEGLALEEFLQQLRSARVYRAARRGASTHMRERVKAAAIELRTADRVDEPAKLRLRETRRELERGWLATSEMLRSQGQNTLAEQTRNFVRSLPPARTEREWLVAGLLGRVLGNRERERADHLLARSR